MIKKIIKKLTMLTAIIGIITVNSVNAFAVEIPYESNNTVEETEEKDSGISLQSSSTLTIKVPHNESLSVTQVNMGFNPTVTVTARGASNLTYKVWVVNPVGITGDIGYVRANGSTISKNLYLSVGGNYHVYIQPWEGSTAVYRVSLYLLFY